MIRLEIPLEPKSWLAPIRSGRRMYDKRADYKNDVILLLKAQYKGPTISAALRVTYYFHLPIPASTSKKNRLLMKEGKIPHISKPDLGNLEKLVSDTLQSAGILKNDSQIVSCNCFKLYSENPMTVILIYGD